MDFILEDAFNNAYRPFFEVLKDYKDLKVNLHFSGFLFQWILDRKPDYIALLKSMRERGQVEIVSGGMYEPVFSLIPEEDVWGQIGMHGDLMKEVFGVRPRGLWLAERVYEPHLPRTFAKAGIEYTLVDDNHFKAIGLEDDDLFGYYVVEHEGHKLSVFPGLEFLRYAIPFKPLTDLDTYLREAERKGHDLAVFGDDGEKFGLWPGTQKSVYEEKWLKRFFEYLIDNQNWLRTVTFSEYMADSPPRGLVYLDCQSYKEMGEWCLPPRLSKKYGAAVSSDDPEDRALLRGGYFKHFLVKYPESNDMHKKMLSVTKQANSNHDAKKHVYMAQCNDSYWHGVFGGLYLPHLRASVYGHLIEAEKRLDQKKPFVSGVVEDVNMDGANEAVLANNVVKAYFCLKEGGSLYELDYKPAAVNLMANLCRRYEGYHDKITLATNDVADGTRTIHDMITAKEEGLERFLHYDWYRRSSLVDHVLGRDVTWESFFKCLYQEPGDFVKEPYEAVLKKEKKSVTLSLARKGHFWRSGKGIPLAVEKAIVLNLDEAALSVDYCIHGDVEESFLFGVELNFSFLGSGGDRYMDLGSGRIPLTAKGIYKPSKKICLFDPYQKVAPVIECDQPISIWTFPVEVVSLSETGFERNYQSTMCMPLWDIDLKDGPRTIHIKLILNGLSSHNDL